MNEINFPIPPKTPGENSRQYAYRVLLDAIMSLRFPPGTVLSDGELSEALGISRTPVREAIMSLAESRLVTVYPQKSSCVSLLSLASAEEGLFLRYQTERAILQEAVCKAGSDSLLAMGENLAAQKNCLLLGDKGGFMMQDNAFHKLLYLSVNRPWTWTVVMGIVTHLDRIRFLQVHQNSMSALESAYAEHCAIFDAIMSRSTEPMDEFLHSHLTGNYHRDILELIRLYPDYFEPAYRRPELLTLGTPEYNVTNSLINTL